MGSPGAQGEVPRLERRDGRPQLQLARRHPLRRRHLRRQLDPALRRHRPRHPHHGHDGRRRRRREPGRHGAGGALDRLPQHERGRRHPDHLHRVLRVVHRADRSRRPEPGPGDGAGRDQQLLGLPGLRGLQPGQLRGHAAGGRERARGRHLRRRLGRQRRLRLLDREHSGGDLRRRLLGRRDTTTPTRSRASRAAVR